MFLVIFTIFIVANIACAQAPSYIISNWVKGASTAQFTFSSWSQRIQSIYYPSDLKAIPDGAVKYIYFRMGRSNPVLLDTCSYHNLEIRLGYTTKTQFNLTAEDSLITGLTPVYFASTRFFSGLLSGMGTWLKFPVSDFILDHKSNLVIEISNGIEPTQNNGKFDLIASNKTNPIARSIIAPKDSAIGSAGISNVLDVGFDINPTGVAGINNIQAMGLFPNPSTDGYFVLSLESGKAIKTLSVAIMDVTGRTVLRKEYASVGTEFGQEIDARQLPKGCYMVLINADGEKITRKLLLQ